MNRRFVSTVITFAAFASLAAGCGQSVAPLGIASPGTLESVTPAKSSGYLYTCQNAASTDCIVYKGSKQVRTITKGLAGPEGLAAGVDGLFYVVQKTGKDVLVFAAGGAKVLATLSNAGNVPVDIAVDNGELAVANQTNVTIFTKGSKKPTATLKDSAAMQGTGIAFDPKGNCYWSFTTKSGAEVDEFAGCKGSAKRLSISPGVPYALAFDGSGNLYYTSYQTQLGVYKCSGLSSCAQTYTNTGFIHAQFLNFNKGYTDLWVADHGNYSRPAALFEIDVATGKTLRKLTYGLTYFDPPTGVAFGPGPL